MSQAILDKPIGQLNDHLTVMKEAELRRLLLLEVRGRRRDYVVRRIFTRWHKLVGVRLLGGFLSGKVPR